MNNAERQFKTGYKTNQFFYFTSGMLTLFIALVKHTFELPAIIGYSVLFAGSFFAFHVMCQLAEIKHETYGMLQSMAFTVINVFMSAAFDSAQVFIYAMCFSSVLNFVFINQKLSKFQFVQSFIISILYACAIGFIVNSPQTMLVYSFGVLMLMVTNWIIVSMTNHLNFQYRKNDEQERSLDDMLKVVEAKRDEAQHATHAKSQFLAHMSHEIRTPINTIIGMNEMILRESSDREIVGYANEVRSAADSLLGIINDILDITRIESGKMIPIYAEYDSASLINDICNMIRFKAAEKKLEFKVIVDEELPRRLKGDDIRLKQIIVNLLSNAVKYTHDGSITFEIKYFLAGNIYVSVQDTGIGIKREDIERIFVAFDRIEEDKNRNIEGTGLGLNITSSLLKMFGSELKVKSIYGQGSKFSFMITHEVIDPTPVGRLNLSDVKYEQHAYKTSFVAPEAKILIVDDNDMNRRVFCNLLKKTRVQITEAASGAACLNEIKKTRYDIIFMDHMMPEMDGIETFRKIRGSSGHLCADVPVVILTANAVVGAEEAYLKEGFDGFLSKPINPQKLEKSIVEILGEKGIGNAFADETAENMQRELPIINGVDWAYARLHFEDDVALLDTVKMFRRAIKSDADELDGYFANLHVENAIDSYRIKVHSMKSSAALIGIVNLAGMAMELENAARSGNTDAIKAVHPTFAARWRAYYNDLSEFCEDTSEKKNAGEHRNEIQEIVMSIRKAADAMDVDMLDKLSARLDEYAFSGVYAKRAEEIKSQIFNFEVEKLDDCRIFD